jgi:ferric-dicitrate binding protein FerR (iron transport regulator)
MGELIATLRDEWGVQESENVDWRAIERTVFARIKRERSAERARFSAGRHGLWALAGAIAVAFLGVVAVLAGKGREIARVDPVTNRDGRAGKIVDLGGAGPVLVNGSAARSGALVVLGDVIETRGSEVTIAREGSVTFTVENNSRLSVSDVRGPLVLTLERGAVRAHVTPVADGEAFAVDVAPSRVAVHGTLFRVSRAGSHAAVDLIEGVLSVGNAPRSGPVMGTIVTAPAHAEFMVSDAVATMKVTHDLDAVRPLAPSALPSDAESADVAVQRLRAKGQAEGALPQWSPPINGRPSPRVVGSASAGPELAAGSSGPMPRQAAADATASDAIESAVLACMAERPHPDNVTVLVHTTLYLEIGDDGSVRTARFDPPVAPEVNGCASSAIYKAHFPQRGAVAIPVDFKN